MGSPEAQQAPTEVVPPSVSLSRTVSKGKEAKPWDPEKREKQVASQEICKKFARRNACARGDRCPFIHTVVERGDKVWAADQPGEAQNRYGRKRHARVARELEIAGAAAKQAAQMLGVSDVDHVFTQTIWPAAAPVDWDSLPASLSQTQRHPERQQRKRWQVDTFAVLLRRLIRFLDATQPARGRTGRRRTVVDFGSGSGNFALPLAATFPELDFVLVDMCKKSAELAQERADDAKLRNVRAVCARIEEFDIPFDVGLGLHACGAASDLAHLACFRHRASYILCPCCIGKMKAAADLVSYPRSQRVASAVSAEQFANLASAADHSDETDAQRRLCKVMVEMDRDAAAREAGYSTLLTQLPKKATPKHDVLIGVPGFMDLSSLLADAN